MRLSDQSLGFYAKFYEKIPIYLDLYPAFFRFFYAISLDLEALGLSGWISTLLKDYVLKHELHICETSDVRRMEVRNLLHRSGVSLSAGEDKALLSRVNRFLGNASNFKRFNKPVFYDVTHLILFQTNLGQEKMNVTEGLKETLSSVGVLAYLDDDIDLLSEVCICFKILDLKCPELWQQTCVNFLKDFKITIASTDSPPKIPRSDDYHIYLVGSWFKLKFGFKAFEETFNIGASYFEKPEWGHSTLRSLSQYLHKASFSQEGMRREIPIKPDQIFNARQIKVWEKAKDITPNAHSLLGDISKGLIV